MSAIKDREVKPHRPPLDAEQAKSLSESSVLARVRWRYRPDSFVVAPKGVKVGDLLTLESLDLGIETLQVTSVNRFSPEQAMTDGFLDSFDCNARLATAEERQKRSNNLVEEKQIWSRTQSESDINNLKMKVLGAELALDRSKVLIIYTADGRVDFRELLKTLASTFHIRIEFRQLFARDAAKLIGGIGVCGLPICCSAFLTSFASITINMAKNQLLPLSIPKLSGQCGRLMCCLAFENDLYTQIRPQFPNQGSTARYDGRIYKVISLNVLSDSIVATDGESYQNFTSDEWAKLPAATKIEFNEQRTERKQHE